MIEVIRYSSFWKEDWDAFVKKSKNGTFLLLRDYVDYHSDRFEDCSLMFRDEKGNIQALLPANRCGECLSSHNGLTYGGLLTDDHITTTTVLSAFQALKAWMKENGLRVLRYKAIPYIYHKVPADEDLYALTQCFPDIKIEARDISTTVTLQTPLPWRELRRRGVRKAGRNGIVVVESDDFNAFWKILDRNLSMKYGTHPVHSLEEILLLKHRFPEKIRLFLAMKGEEVLAGVLMYDANDTCVHSQYISSTEEGRSQGALDAVFYHLLTSVYTHERYFDFGKSTEGDSSSLNAHLIFQKEGFGGRGVCYDIYLMSVDN